MTSPAAGSVAADFSHLRMHSEFDISKGIARINGSDSVIEYAAQLQQPALALTDNGNVFGAIKFYSRCREKGIKPIIGCEVKIDARNEYYLLLLCADEKGYVNLNRLLSRMYSDNACAQTEWMTPETTAGIIALSGGKRGDIGAAIAHARLDVAEKHARNWMARFPERFYIEIWRDSVHDNNHAAAAADIGSRLGVPVAATHPVQCTRAADKEILDIKLCIAAGRRIFDTHRPRPLSEQPYLLSADEMRARFSDIPGALENSIEIAKRCNFAFEFGKVHLPSLPQQGAQPSADLLRQEAEHGLCHKLPDNLAAPTRQKYDERLHYELDMIDKMQFSDYFLIVMDFIRWAKKNNIPVGPGRGSGAGSLVAYALDITTLDPLEYNLLFERFLNPERISMPDFDVDFCVNGRDQVIRYVEERYGKDRVSQIVTFGTIGAKGAVRDVGRVLGIAYGYCDKLARMIPNTPKITITQALADVTDFAEQRQDEEGGRLIELALKVEGLPRNVGTHAGGVLISPHPMEIFCPKYAAADTDTLVSQYDMGDIERIGLVKFDFLGLRTLTILADAEREVRRQYQPEFSLEDIPLDDAGAYRVYSSGDSIGVFQCESAGMRELMKQLQPDRFTDLIALVALYRPGPLGAGMDVSYISRKHGKEDVTYPHDLLEPVLNDTYGLFIYQEQVMEIARRISGYSLSEADILRRAMGKKDEKKMASMRESFIAGSREYLPQEKAQKLFNDMAQFAEYGFNKSHAAAYATLSYRTAYLKARYPAIFLSAVLSAEADNTDRVKLLLKDARRLKIQINAPDINKSAGEFRAVDENAIEFGLKAIKGIGAGVIHSIVQARGATSFRNLFDFCTRTAGNVPAAALELLAQAGAFDSLHPNRAAVKMTVPSALTQNFNAGNLFANDSGSEELADTPEWTLREKLTHEHHAFGFPLSGHYYQLYKHIIPQLPLSRQHLRGIEVSENITIAGVFVRISKRPGKKSGVLILRDNEHEIEVLIPRDTMKILSGDNITSELLIVQGRAFSGFRGGIAISAGSVETLDTFLSRRLRRAVLHCDDESCPALLREMLMSSRRPQQTHEIILHCKNNDITYDVSLGGCWMLDHTVYQQLRQTAQINPINLEF